MDRIKVWFQGRNGFDALNYAFLILAAAMLPWRFTRGFGAGFLILAIFRIFSRNVYKRQAENAYFMTLINMIKQRFASWRAQNRARPKESKNYSNVYNIKDFKVVRCPQCKQKLRLPRHKGKLRVTCKKCGHRFEKNT